jgi:hypothetical protein
LSFDLFFNVISTIIVKDGEDNKPINLQK